MTPRFHFLRRLKNASTLNSLRLQLLLWIALPVGVIILGMSTIEIRGHERAMTQMVQEQADLVAHSLGVAISAHIEQREGILQRLAGEYVAGNTSVDTPDPAFTAGLTLLNPAEPTGAQSDPAWAADSAVVALAEEVHAAQRPGLATLFDDKTQAWLLVQAVPISTLDAPDVLAGAEPVEALIQDHFATFLAPPAAFAQLQLNTSRGELLYSYSSHLDAATGEPVDGGQEQERRNSARWITGETIILPTGWQVTVHKDWRETVAPVLTFGNTLLATAVVTALLALVSAYFGLRNIVWPLQRLDEAASQVGWGNYAAIQQPVGGIAEIEELRAALARMTEQIRQYQRELQSYIGAMTLGQEDERRRLARELHDETVQDLIALSQQVELAVRALERDPAHAANRLQDLRPQITAIIDGLRRQIHALRPLYLEDLGFVSAIEMLLRQVTQRHGLTSEFTVTDDTDETLAPAIQIGAYRIVQEALQNVVRHAHATHIDLHLSFSDDEITLTVTDNGRGFSAPNQPFRLAQQGHYGLLGMQERAQLYGGALQIESRPGDGTRVTVSLPHHEPPAASQPRANQPT